MKAEKIRKFIVSQWVVFMIIMIIAFIIFPHSSQKPIGWLAILLTINHFILISILFFTGKIKIDDVPAFVAIAVGVSFFAIVLPQFPRIIIYWIAGILTGSALMYHLPNLPKKIKEKLRPKTRMN